MDTALSPWSGEFREGRLEELYRRRQTTAELRQLRLLWSVALLCFLLFWPLDWLAAQDSNRAGNARIIIVGVGGLVLLLSRWPLPPRWRDATACVALIAAMASYGALLAARGHGPGALPLLVLGAYLFSPGRFFWLMTSAMLGSLLAVLQAGSSLAWPDAAFIAPAHLLALLALAQLNRGRRRLFLESQRLRNTQRALVRLHRKNTALLYNTLPRDVARQLRDEPGRRPARLLPMVTVIYADLEGFSALARTLGPGQLVALLDRLFSAFDDACARYGTQKIKTLGDGYLAVAGLGGRDAGADAAASTALLFQQQVARLSRDTGLRLSLRVGLHSGSVVAGVLGQSRYAFDIWGDTVNVACRLQAEAAPGSVLVSASVRKACRKRWQFGPEHTCQLRGCGPVVACRLQLPRRPGKASSTALATSSAEASAAQSTVMSA
ncbi:MAG: adenylate/guanylate cyclase domain-containing protein [Halieaceae bacterium]|jgi:class 3 adenylate cyclase|nr:adenylate/guanylate cyclase domain-containing protein [Halieaceae bacterium]